MSETFTNNVILDKVEKGVSTEDLQNTYINQINQRINSRRVS